MKKIFRWKMWAISKNKNINDITVLNKTILAMKRFAIPSMLIPAVVFLSAFRENTSENKVNATPGASIANVRIVEGNEGQRMVEVMVIIPQAVANGVTMTYTTRNGTATGGSDFVPVDGSLHFDGQETMKKVTIAIKGDVLCEEDETFQVVLSHATGTSLTDSIGTVTIINDDCFRNGNSSGGNSGIPGSAGSGNPNVSAYEIKLTYTGYTTEYPDITPCRIRTNGTVVLAGLVWGDEKSAGADDPVQYVGVLNLEIDMDLCTAVAVEAPGGGYPNCGLTVVGLGPVKTELELDSTGTRYGYIKLNYDRSLGLFVKGVTGGCDRQTLSEQKQNVPNETQTAIFNGRELPLPMHALRVGRYTQTDNEGNVTTIEVIRKIH